QQPVLATRIEADKATELIQQFPTARYNAVARTLRIDSGPPRPGGPTGGGGVCCDLDCGGAGPQRLLAKLDRITKADAVVVVAGMEAALASVVGGHVACPVIAVPTSVGYGASLGGIAALLGMLNSCAANVSVVNIDAGVNGGYVAGQ